MGGGGGGGGAGVVERKAQGGEKHLLVFISPYQLQ